MDAEQALADLTEISSQIQTAVLLDGSGAVAGATFADAERATRLADGALRLLEAAREVGAAHDGDAPAQLEAALPEGSVFVVREGGRTIVATTAPEPTVGLVFYDLKSCLRSLDEAPEQQPKPKARRARKQAETEGGDGAA